MGSKHNHEDLAALMGYIEELESSLAKKDEQIAAKDQRIGTLEAEVSATKRDAKASMAPAFRVKVAAEPVTPRALPVGDAAWAPNHVSDDSGEAESESQGSPGLSRSSLSRSSLSQISRAHSSDEDSAAGRQPGDGRWNIPFDGSFEGGLVANSPSGKGAGHRNALREIAFVPIGEEGRSEFSTRQGVTPVRPVARNRGVSPFARHAVEKESSNDAMKGKENAGRKKHFSPVIGTSRCIR